jgi:hypothetical protein
MDLAPMILGCGDDLSELLIIFFEFVAECVDQIDASAGCLGDRFIANRFYNSPKRLRGELEHRLNTIDAQMIVKNLKSDSLCDLKRDSQFPGGRSTIY